MLGRRLVREPRLSNHWEFVMQDSVNHQVKAPTIPFDTCKLDALMEAAGIEVLLATSKHNVQYLLNAERAIFFDYMDALGVSRYLPVLIYPRGAPAKAGYVGNPLEAHQRSIEPLWVGEVQYKSRGSVDSITRAVDIIKKSGVPAKRIGVEMAFLTMDAGRALAGLLPDTEIKDALFVLERLRAVKSKAELAKLKKASELVTESMLEVIGRHGPGT